MRISIPEARFFAGGQASIRGFDLNSVGPVTFGFEGRWCLRVVERLFILNEELRIPVWGALRFAVFTDIGQVWPSWRDADLESVRGCRRRAAVVDADRAAVGGRRVAGGQRRHQLEENEVLSWDRATVLARSRPKTALFGNLGVDLRIPLCGVQKYASAQILDLLDLARKPLVFASGTARSRLECPDLTSDRSRSAWYEEVFCFIKHQASRFQNRRVSLRLISGPPSPCRLRGRWERA